MTNLHDWLFHYNIYIKKWEATKRDNYRALFCGGDNIFRSSNIDTLIELIRKTNGEKKKIKKLLKN